MGINEEGSDLSGVSANCWWSECSKSTIYRAAAQANNYCNNSERPISSTLSVRIRSSLNKLVDFYTNSYNNENLLHLYAGCTKYKYLFFFCQERNF